MSAKGKFDVHQEIIGDGGVHFTLVCLRNQGRALAGDELEQLREEILDRVVNEFGGSFSAEQAIGRSNQRFYDRYTPDTIKRIAANLGSALTARPFGAARFGITR